jgi:hypothetical protein
MRSRWSKSASPDRECWCCFIARNFLLLLFSFLRRTVISHTLSLLSSPWTWQLFTGYLEDSGSLWIGWHNHGHDERSTLFCYVVWVVDSYVARTWSPASLLGISRDLWIYRWLFNYKISNTDSVFDGMHMNVSARWKESKYHATGRYRLIFLPFEFLSCYAWRQ